MGAGSEAVAEMMVVYSIAPCFFRVSASCTTVDRFCPMNKAYWMLKVLVDFYQRTQTALETGISLEQVLRLPVIAHIARMKERPMGETEEALKTLMERVRFSFAELGVD